MIIQTIVDAVAVLMACLFAAWCRFGSGLIPLFHDSLPPRKLYITGSILAAVIVVLALHATHSYTQRRLTKPISGLVLGVLLILAGAVLFRTEPPFSRIVLALSAVLILVGVLAERSAIVAFTRNINGAANQASQATSEPAPGAASSSREG